MMRRKHLYLMAAFAGLAILGPPPTARADFEIAFSTGGASIVIDVTTQTATASGGASLAGSTIIYNSKTNVTVENLTIDPNAAHDGNSGGFSIGYSIIATTNSPGTPTLAQISNSGIGSVTNQGSSTGSLTITTASTGFTMPATNPVVLKSTAGASADATNSATASLVVNSYLNTDNSQFGHGTGTNPAGFGAPQINLGPVSPGNSASAPNGGTSTLGNPGATPYSLVEVATYTLGAGDDFFDNSVATNVTATPAPAGLVLVLSGLPVLGLGVWVRRSKLATV